MTTREMADILAGTHWLCHLSRELNTDAKKQIDELEAWDWTAGEVALAIIEASQPNGTTRESKIHIRCWPWEKAAILRAAYPNKLEDFVRTALIEKAMTTEIIPSPYAKDGNY